MFVFIHVYKSWVHIDFSFFNETLQNKIYLREPAADERPLMWQEVKTWCYLLKIDGDPIID